MLVFDQVSKGSLRNISFQIKSDEFVILYNDDIAKIELICNLITGKQKPESGLISFLNYENIYDPLIRRYLGLVYKDNILLPERTIKQNMLYFFDIKGLYSLKPEMRIKEILDFVNLKNYLDRKPLELLPHEKVRANIAQALLGCTRLLVLENPTDKVDEVNTRSLFNLLTKISKSGITVFVLTSDCKLLLPGRKKKLIVLKEEELVLTEKR